MTVDRFWTGHSYKHKDSKDGKFIYIFEAFYNDVYKVVWITKRGEILSSDFIEVKDQRQYKDWTEVKKWPKSR